MLEKDTVKDHQSIPAHERWLFKNKKAAKMLQAGLEDAAKGNLVDASEDYSKYSDGSNSP